MGKKTGSGRYTEVEYQESVDPALKGLVMQHVGDGENPHEVFNELLRQNRSKRLYSADGVTRPTHALALHLEAERDIRHSVKLARNLGKSGQSKVDGDESHHVVAARAARAFPARRIMFSVGIGVNDARNGVNLRSAVHAPIHTAAYYVEVNTRLIRAETLVQHESLQSRNEHIGNELLDMGVEIESGVFLH